MSLRSVFLACAAALIVSVNSQAAYYSGLEVSYSMNGSVGSSGESISGESVLGQKDVLLVMAPGPKGLQIEGEYESFKDQNDFSVLGYVGWTATGAALGEEINYSFSATIEFTLDQAISATAILASLGYNSGPVAGTYEMTINGNSVPFGSTAGEPAAVNLLKGLNQVVVTGFLSSPSLGFELNEVGGGYLIFDAEPAPVPEPGSWALMAFGGAVAFMAARRKLSGPVPN